MSWDVFISKTPIDQLESNPLEVISSKNQILQDLKKILVNVDFSDPTWGIYNDDNCSIEISIDDEQMIDHLMLHIRGDSMRPLIILKEICESLECEAMDGSSGEAINFDNLDKNGLQSWQEYRNRVLKKD